MTKSQKVALSIIGLFGLIAILLFGLFSFFVYRPSNFAPEPVFSADGSKVIIPTVNSNKSDSSSFLLVHLEIRDVRSGKTLFQIQSRASDRMRWSVYWIDNTTIKLDSSDIGVYCWKEGNDNTWVEIKCP